MSSITADPALLRRYDRPAPRYTSYPAATQFGPEFTADELREQIACRTHRFRSINVDLIYGLPRQTLAGFSRTLDTVLGVRPERLAIYSYAHLPHLFKPQRQIHAPDLPSPELKLELLQLAIEKLSETGYQYIGMDHFAIPEDDLSQAQAAHSLHRNFMGYSTHASCDLLGLGVSSISHIGNSFSQTPRELPHWEKLVDAGKLPVWRGRVLDEDDLLRSAVIATCFDRYLQSAVAATQPRHSRAI
jgi:oxygen-independent coproporphyrinogen III oxidase